MENYKAIGFVKEDIRSISEALAPMINLAAGVIPGVPADEKTSYQIFFRAFEALQDNIHGKTVEPRYRARYVSKLVYDNADYSVKPSKFKTILNLNLDKAGVKPGQKGAQTTVEHSMPRKMMFDTLVEIAKEQFGVTPMFVADFIERNNEIVVLSYEESTILDSKYRCSSPNLSDKFSRYKAMGIKLVDVQTGEII